MADVNIPVGRVQVATPATMAESIRNNTVATDAVDERIEDVAADIIASDPTIKAGAAAALDAELAEKDVVQGGDPRLVDEGADNKFRVRDQNGNTSALFDEFGNTHFYGDLNVGNATVRPYDGLRVRDLNGKVALDVNPLSGQTFIGDLAGALSASNAPRVHVLIGLGQSNMEGRGQPYGARLDPQPKSRLMWDWTGNRLVQATVPLSSQQQQVGLSPLSVIAGEVEKYDEDAAVVILNAGVGNSGLVSQPVAGTWRVGHSGAYPALWPLARTAISQTLSAVAVQFPSAVIVPWVFWHQGEADAATSEAAYAAALDELFTAVRTHLGQSTVPIALGGLVPEYIAADSRRPAIRNAQIGAQARLEYVAYADGTPNGGGSQNVTDTVHYARGGVERLGRNMWAAAQRASSASASSVPHKPLDVTATRNGNTVTASWSQPNSRATNYVIEWRSSGGSWSTVTRTTTPADTSDSFAVSGSAIEVRISTVNGSLTSAATLPYLIPGA